MPKNGKEPKRQLQSAKMQRQKMQKDKMSEREREGESECKREGNEEGDAVLFLGLGEITQIYS